MSRKSYKITEVSVVITQSIIKRIVNWKGMIIKLQFYVLKGMFI